MAEILRAYQKNLKRKNNFDSSTIKSFGDEWSFFDQQKINAKELRKIWKLYFKRFPWKSLPTKSVGCDFGCGSGRWAKLVAPKVGKLICVDASQKAIKSARKNLRHIKNCFFKVGKIGKVKIPDNSFDFAYSLGVFHHLPNPEEGLRECVKKVKPGGPFLVYLYKSIPLRPWTSFALFILSDSLRKIVCQFPEPLKRKVCDIIATIVYLPLARLAQILEKNAFDVTNFPLSFYRNLSFYTMRTDSRDRFGTPLERRFSRDQVYLMMKSCGLECIRFNKNPPYWTALGYRKTIQNFTNRKK